MKAVTSMPVTVARIERALALCANLVARDLDGIVYVPIMARLEAELIAARAVEDPVRRARQLLDAYGGSRGHLVEATTPAARPGAERSHYRRVGILPPPVPAPGE